MSFDHTEFMKGCYQLPGDPSRDVYVVPVSGGADSTALAIMMDKAFPAIDLKMVFTDTGAEDAGVLENLDNLERYLGKSIHRIVPEKSLWDLIRGWGNFLPSSRNRWCTATLKIKPFERFLGSIKPIFGGQVWSFVGIRSDEPWRTGLVSQDDDVHTELPFKAWKIDRDAVFRILELTVGVPRLYKGRTRSGCSSCWGMRRWETVSLLDWHPVEFRQGASVEKLSAVDQAKHQDFISVPAELGIGLNWVGFPLPREIDPRCKETQQHVYSAWQFFDLRPARTATDGKVIDFPKKRWEGERPTEWAAIPQPNQDEGAQVSLLSVLDPMVRLFVGVEFHIDPGIGGDGVFWQAIVSFSTSRAGLARQMQGHYEHRLHTAEASGLSPEEVRLHVKYAVYLIEAPKTLMDTDAPSEGSFTWKAGESYDQVERLTQFARRTLHAARIEQDMRIAETNGKAGLAQVLGQQRARITGPLGRLLGMGSYVAREPQGSVEEEDVEYVPCFACSL
jgi:hypothetical protein